MPPTKLTNAKYTRQLDGMAGFISKFLFDNQNNDAIRRRAEQGLLDFCYQYPAPFKSDFLSRVGCPKPRRRRAELPSGLRDDFLRKLQDRGGECVFLLRDAVELMSAYQARTGRGFGIMANRSFICGDEQTYFHLIEAIYKGLENETDYDQFLESYYDQFVSLLGTFPRLSKAAKEISDYILSHTVEEELTLVDLGLQFTMSLFCYGSLRHFSARKIAVSMYNFSSYPWLMERFSEQTFCDHSDAVIPLEVRGMRTFQASLLRRAQGALVGFAIGDALGAPVAGVEQSDVPRLLEVGIEDGAFRSSPRHPFFGRLKAGQYTSNTVVMRIMAEHLAAKRRFDATEFAASLSRWASGILDDRVRNRWLGPTTEAAVARLLQRCPPLDAGSRTTRSCAATYRSVPLGIKFRPLAGRPGEDAHAVMSAAASITHNSSVSIAGAVVVGAIVGDLCNGVLPDQAVRFAVSRLPANEEVRELKDRVELALVGGLTDEEARITFGTGSPIDQTLPLALFFFLKYRSDFGAAVRAAAASYRVDSPLERARLGTISWDAALVEAAGGNTDGIAALTGAFVGAHLGLDAIPREFESVEHQAKLQRLGRRLL